MSLALRVALRMPIVRLITSIYTAVASELQRMHRAELLKAVMSKMLQKHHHALEVSFKAGDRSVQPAPQGHSNRLIIEWMTVLTRIAS